MPVIPLHEDQNWKPHGNRDLNGFSDAQRGVYEPPISPERFVELIQSIADDVRLEIVLFLLAHPIVVASDLVFGIKISKAMVSHHTKILEQSGVLKRRKSGKLVYFSVRKERIIEMKRFLGTLLEVQI